MITLRFARPEDADALLEIYRPYVEETAISFETSVPSREEFLRRITEISAFYPYLLAESDEQILGYAYAHEFGERGAFRWTVETSIYVRRDCRGAGVGARLYRALFELLRAQGMRTACAIITCPNDPSFAFRTSDISLAHGGASPICTFPCSPARRLRRCPVRSICWTRNTGPAPSKTSVEIPEIFPCKSTGNMIVYIVRVRKGAPHKDISAAAAP